jgi:hypothetical protein
VLVRLTARAHVALIRATDRAARAVDGLGRAERGQGTVEYVALVLLVGAVLASVVAIANKTKFGDQGIAETIVKKIKQAMGKVAG